MRAKDLNELIAWLKANPDKASAGFSSSSLELILRRFQKEAGTHFALVPYRGGAPAIQDLVAGQIDLVLETPLQLPLVRGGSIRAYAVRIANGDDTRIHLVFRGRARRSGACCRASWGGSVRRAWSSLAHPTLCGHPAQKLSTPPRSVRGFSRFSLAVNRQFCCAPAAPVPTARVGADPDGRFFGFCPLPSKTGLAPRGLCRCRLRISAIR